MAMHIVGVGEWAVSKDPADIIKTFALGSCVAAMIFGPKRVIVVPGRLVNIVV